MSADAHAIRPTAPVRPHQPPHLPRRRRAWASPAWPSGRCSHRDGVAARTRSGRRPTASRTSPPKAKSVIWIFLSGGVSHLETFDPKPALNKYAGKTFAETPLPGPAEVAAVRSSTRATSSAAPGRTRRSSRSRSGSRSTASSASTSPTGCRTSPACVDDIAFVRSMYTTDNDHAAEFQMHTGRHALDEQQPVIGSWVQLRPGHAQREPAAVRLPRPVQGPAGEEELRRRLPRPAARRRRAVARPDEPAAVRAPAARACWRRSRQNEFDFVNELNGLAAVEYPDDEQLRARIKAYELAYRMQMAVPEVLDLTEGDDRDAGALRHRQPDDGGLRPAAARGPAAGRAGRAVHAVLPQRLRRVGLAQRPEEPARPQCRARRQAARRAAQGPEADRAGQGRAGRLLHRVRPHAGAGDARRVQDADRPRPPPARVHGLVRRGRHQARRRSTGRPTSWASTRSSTRTTSPTSTPRCSTGSASTRGGSTSPAASGSTSTTGR